MEQYIPKSAIVAEIEKKKINEINLDSIEDWRYRLQREHDIEVMKSTLSLINTLEVKEVDLDKEYKEYVEKDLVYNQLVNGIVGKAIAKHFFELGLKAQIMTSKLQQRISVLKMEFWTGLQSFDESEMTLSDAYNQGIDDILEELDLRTQKKEVE